MTTRQVTLQGLLVEDDPEYAPLLLDDLQHGLDEFKIRWKTTQSFDEAAELARTRHFDIVVSDIYDDPSGRVTPTALDIVRKLRETRFCPILLVTSGARPEGLQVGPFLGFADKARSDDMRDALLSLLRTGVPEIARRLHDELDSASSSYLWKFLDKNWGRLKSSGLCEPAILERLARKRVAVQLGRLDPVSRTPTEVATIAGLEFYLAPAISGPEFRLGEILRRKRTKRYRVVLTPHCHLAIQPGQASPRAGHVLTVRTVPATQVCALHPVKPKKEAAKLQELRRRIQCPVEVGKPDGRYWFLPGFLDMPDLYCDFMQLESLEYQTLQDKFTRVAVLDAPFAEALQSCFLRFYAAVGIPSLDPQHYRHLLPDS